MQKRRSQNTKPPRNTRSLYTGGWLHVRYVLLSTTHLPVSKVTWSNQNMPNSCQKSRKWEWMLKHWYAMLSFYLCSIEAKFAFTMPYKKLLFSPCCRGFHKQVCQILYKLDCGAWYVHVCPVCQLCGELMVFFLCLCCYPIIFNFLWHSIEYCRQSTSKIRVRNNRRKEVHSVLSVQLCVQLMR